MRAVIQRVCEASVAIEGRMVCEIGVGLLVLLGVGQGDAEADVEYLAQKTLGLRILSDEAGRMNRSAVEMGSEILVVSQFTLYGDCRKGRRPGYSEAASPEVAEPLYRRYVQQLRVSGLRVEEGTFGALMQVRLVNDGPVTLLLDSRRAF